ncbi:MAG TPA: hypothetical protein VKK61_00905, partial [Tepidisphaeraceae bacterium]|nr:hypothetical protein [Tepidisphaeraceae bacterium]
MLRRFAPLLFCMIAVFSAHAQTTRESTFSRSELSQKSDEAITRGVKFLLAHQNADGSWSIGRPTDREGGHTALITLALLSCGESPQSPPLQKAIKFLKAAQPQKGIHATYCIGLRACVYAELPEAQRNTELRSDLRWLQEALI